MYGGLLNSGILKIQSVTNAVCSRWEEDRFSILSSSEGCIEFEN